MKQISEELFEILCENSTEATSYSGRGMYGEHCLGFTTDDDGMDWETNVFESLNCDEDLTNEFLRLMRRKQIDTMGYGYIIYFPGYAYPDEKNN